jgi:hypothetical protein
MDRDELEARFRQILTATRVEIERGSDWTAVLNRAVDRLTRNVDKYLAHEMPLVVDRRAVLEREGR